MEFDYLQIVFFLHEKQVKPALWILKYLKLFKC